MSDQQTEPVANRQAKDTVFRMVFREKRYQCELYSSLFPSDPPVADDEIETITLENVLASREHNDVAFLVRSRLMILVEAQSTWSVNTLVRLLIYLLHEYYEYITKHKLNLFSRTPVALPVPHLFIIYTGRDKKDVPTELSLRRDFFGGAQTSLDLTAKVIRDGAQGDIIHQYVGFTHVFDEQVRLHGRTAKAIGETIRICMDKDLLREYLAAHEKEAYNAMQLFTEEFIEEAIREEARREGRQEGILEGEQRGRQEGILAGRQEGILNTLFGLVRDNMLTVQNAADRANLSLNAFTAKMAEYEAMPSGMTR